MLSIKQLIDRKLRTIMAEQLGRPAIGRNERRSIQKRQIRAQQISHRFSITEVTKAIAEAAANSSVTTADHDHFQSIVGNGDGNGQEAVEAPEEQARRERREKREQEKKRLEHLAKTANEDLEPNNSRVTESNTAVMKESQSNGIDKVTQPLDQQKRRRRKKLPRAEDLSKQKIRVRPAEHAPRAKEVVNEQSNKFPTGQAGSYSSTIRKKKSSTSQLETFSSRPQAKNVTRSKSRTTYAGPGLDDMSDFAEPSISSTVDRVSDDDGDGEEDWGQFRKVGQQQRRITLSPTTRPTKRSSGRMQNNASTKKSPDKGDESLNSDKTHRPVLRAQISTRAGYRGYRVPVFGTLYNPDPPINFIIPTIPGCDKRRAEIAGLMACYLKGAIYAKRADISWIYTHASPETRELILLRSQNPSFVTHIKTTLVPISMRKGFEDYLRGLGLSVTGVSMFGADRIEGSLAYDQKLRKTTKRPADMKKPAHDAARNMARSLDSPKKLSIPEIESCDILRRELAALIVYSASRARGYTDVSWIYGNAGQELQKLILSRSTRELFRKSFLAAMVEKQMRQCFDEYLKSQIDVDNFQRLSFCGVEYMDELNGRACKTNRKTPEDSNFAATKKALAKLSTCDIVAMFDGKKGAPSDLHERWRLLEQAKKTASTLEPPIILDVPSIPTCDDLRCEFAALIMYSMERAFGSCDMVWIYKHGSKKLKNLLYEKSKQKSFYCSIRASIIPDQMKDEFTKFFERLGFGVISLFFSELIVDDVNSANKKKANYLKEENSSVDDDRRARVSSLFPPEELNIPNLGEKEDAPLCEFVAHMLYSAKRLGGLCDLLWVYTHGSSALQAFIVSKAKLTSNGKNLGDVIIPHELKSLVKDYLRQNGLNFNVLLFCSEPIKVRSESYYLRGNSEARELAASLPAPEDLEIPDLGKDNEDLAEFCAMLLHAAQRSGGICDLSWAYVYGSKRLKRLLYYKSLLPSFDKNPRSVIVPSSFREKFKQYMARNGFQSIIMFCSRPIKELMTDGGKLDFREETLRNTSQDAVPAPEDLFIPSLKLFDAMKNEIAGLILYSLKKTEGRCDLFWIYNHASPDARQYIFDKAQFQYFAYNTKASLFHSEIHRKEITRFLRDNGFNVFTAFGAERIKGSHAYRMLQREKMGKRRKTEVDQLQMEIDVPRPDDIESITENQKLNEGQHKNKVASLSSHTNDITDSAGMPNSFQESDDISSKVNETRKRKHQPRQQKLYRHDINISSEPGLTPEQEELARLCVAKNPRLRNIVPEWDHVRKYASENLLMLVGTSTNGVRLRHFVPNDKKSLFERYAARYRDVCLEEADSEDEMLENKKLKANPEVVNSGVIG